MSSLHFCGHKPRLGASPKSPEGTSGCLLWSAASQGLERLPSGSRPSPERFMKATCALQSRCVKVRCPKAEAGGTFSPEVNAPLAGWLGGAATSLCLVVVSFPNRASSCAERGQIVFTQLARSLGWYPQSREPQPCEDVPSPVEGEMQPPKAALGPLLWLASWCLLAAGHPSAQEEAWQPCTQESGSANCPHHTKRSVTLVPSFTETPHLTTHPPKHPTTHHHHRHTTTAPHNQTITSHHPTKTTHHPTTPKKHTTTHHHRHHTTTAPHNQTITSHHPTTPKKHTTTHHHQTTTTAAANGTTAALPTTHHPTTPSNQTVSPHHPTAPANGTTAALPTHHHPTAVPQPTAGPVVLVGNYVVKKGSTVCLRAEMGLQLWTRYTDRAKQQHWGAFAVPPNRTYVSGVCSDKTATLKLHFPEGFILFAFRKNVTENTAYLSQVQANLTYQFPQATEKFFTANNASLREFAAPLGKSYQCRNRSVALSERFRLDALQERVQAFQLRGEEFGAAEVCPGQRHSIVLPIVVGVVLCLLIVIVLVAFAVGRWRAHTGYQSL